LRSPVPSEQRSNPKLENRNPKEIRDQKSEGRAGGFSVFGLRISFGFRISVLGRLALPQMPERLILLASSRGDAMFLA